MAGNASTPERAAELESLPGRGEVIADKYVVDRLLGTGGMGVVLAARHLQLNQPVAIKMLRPKIAKSPEAVARFLREAQAAVAIQSEHVARVLDVGSLASGVPYMVLECLQGTTLDEVLASRGPLPVADAVAYVLQACEAVAEAHSKGIIHRDLKPANLFLTVGPDGAPLIKILDFGIAKIIDLEEEPSIKLTGTGVGMGSPQYMSPEQIRDASSVDTRTDIWSLGVTLHELITRQLPFSGTNFSALCAQIIADPPIRLRQSQPDAPAELEEIILRCLTKPPSKRITSVADLALALLPFGSKSSELSVERISGILKPGRVAELDLPMDRHNSQRIEIISGALSTTVSSANRPSAGRRFLLFSVIGSAVALLTITVLLWVSHGSGPAPAVRGAPVSELRPPAPSSTSTASPVTPVGTAAIAAAPTAAAPTAPALAHPPPREVPSILPLGARTAAPCAGGRPCRKFTAPPIKRLPGSPSVAPKGALSHDPLDDRK
jgi:eukaryotic-like serine/threonine-protein kinase